jgi:D-serine deaminase-like pyridoxal phosphate-dependent protein
MLAHHATASGLQRLSDLARNFPMARISTLVETTDEVAAVPGNVGCFVDVNAGMNRTGIPMEDHETIEMVALACGDRWRGLHFYEGHIRDGEEQSRKERSHAAYDILLRIDANLGGADELVTSGTTTFLHALSHARLVGTMRHTVSPGTVVLHDAISARVPEVARLGLEPAAAVLAHVVSHPRDGIITLNAGHKSVSADAGDPCCAVLGFNGLVPLHPSEEHLPIQVLKGTTPARGELLALVPEHVCPTVNLARLAVLLQDDEVTVVAVRAGGHESPLSTASV